jgi:hypothetical protein
MVFPNFAIVGATALTVAPSPRLERWRIHGLLEDPGGGNDGLNWPHRDGLNWPHLRPIVA